MGDHRKHRGPHPEDLRLFGAAHTAALQAATRDLSWLLSHQYAIPSSLKLVGDRYALDSRQRLGVARCACSDQAVFDRRKSQIDSSQLAGNDLWIDGYNVLTTVEAALAGGVILLGRDGCYRDMASMHGNYRKVLETVPAIQQIGKCLATWQVHRCHWLLDQPVSNSGRLREILLALAEEHGWQWQVELVPDPDRILHASTEIVASSDSQILNTAGRWFNLARAVIDCACPEVRVTVLNGIDAATS